jgi:hypothetical protein
MARPKTKTAATSLKLTPEVRDLWEQCAAGEHRTLTNMFEVMVRDYAKRAGVKAHKSAGAPAATKT